MSKWIKKELFQSFRTELAEDQERKDRTKTADNRVWQKLEKGTVDRPIVYEGRLLPDRDGSPSYKKMHYHMFQRGDQWVYYLCEKTFGFENFCAYCHASRLLWAGTEADKKAARLFNRKEKYVANFYVIDDPRDKDVPQGIENRESRINSGKVKLFEFGVKLESKIRGEILDEKSGLGYAVFDPGDGHDFIIKGKSTKADGKGNVWPDYTDSKFSHSSSSLGSDKDIKAIMDQCADLNEYVKSQRKSPVEVKEMLEKDMLWGLVESEWERVYGKSGNDEHESEHEKQKKPNEQEEMLSESEPEDESGGLDEVDDLDKALKEL
jgi:hypothetical protein